MIPVCTKCCWSARLPRWNSENSLWIEIQSKFIILKAWKRRSILISLCLWYRKIMKVGENTMVERGQFVGLCFLTIKNEWHSHVTVTLKFTIYFSYGFVYSCVGLSRFLYLTPRIIIIKDSFIMQEIASTSASIFFV